MNKGQLASVIYHDLFNYSLRAEEIIKWQVNPRIVVSIPNYAPKNNFHLRAVREKSSEKKLMLARKAAQVLQKIPTIQFIGITGSLAMMNAKPESDIDFLIITSMESMWVTRFMTYLLLKLAGFAIRNPNNKNERDKLCLNMWMDETDLKITQKNLYTAHEIVQIIPLVNKNKTHEKFINQNTWVFSYWPNAIQRQKLHKMTNTSRSVFAVCEPFARFMQVVYMKKKKSRELVTATRAFFHPFDWGERVLSELSSKGLKIN